MPGGANSGRGLHQLPSGRHGLPRTYVIRNQRERILDAVVNVVSDRGYRAATVEDVIAYAGVSRRTFYDHFSGKEEAFLDAYDLIVAQLLGAVRAAYGGGSTWVHRVRRGLGAFLEALAIEPRAAYVCIVEGLAAGPRALERRARAMEEFRRLLAPDPAEAVGEGAPLLAGETVVGGVYEIVYREVLAGRTEQLPVLMPELLHSMLLPFTGPQVAAAEYRAAVHRREQRMAAAASPAQP
jgi:AcrR family transcriptional regulator